MPTEVITAELQLAKLAVAYERGFAVYFPAGAQEMAELGSKILAEHGVAYWISPDGRSLTCVKCRLTTNHPVDVGNRYCGKCHEFLENRSAP